MKLTPEQLRQFDEEGYLFLPGHFSPDEVAVMKSEVPHIFAQRRQENVREKSGDVVRTAFAVHTYNPVFKALVHHPGFVGPAEQMLRDQVYIHQFKINGKAAFDGDVWQWHQDYGTWKNDDDMPTARAMNLAVFIDEVNEFNGPLWFIPRSHKKGVIEASHDLTTTSYPLWTINNDTIAKLVEQGGIVSMKGPPGSALFFHSTLVHGSGPNMSPWGRVIIYVSLNAVSNAIRRFKRPEWIAHRDFTPIDTWNEDSILNATRQAAGKPLRVGLIGAGKFGTMFVASARTTPGLHLAAIADLSPPRAKESLQRTGWPKEQAEAQSIDAAFRSGGTFVTDDAAKLFAAPLDVIIEATGNPAAGIAHALAAFKAGKSVVMVNVEADAVAGALLARRAAEAGVVYSLAYGDQPALICEMVDWARASGFPVVAAGKGTKYLPSYHQSTPEIVWGYYGITPERAREGGMNPQMFNSFLDGTKSAIEMAAVANATGLTAAPQGLEFPPCGVDDLARVLIPEDQGGQLHHAGQVEVISSLERDGRPVFRDLRWGVYVVFEAPSDYVARCFAEYGLITDPSGRYSAMYKPFHLIGLELGISVASVGLRKEATGTATGFRADVVATAKRDLKPGETLDGEGGYMVYGKLMPATDSLSRGGLPLGLAHGIKLTRPVKAGAPLSWSDVAFDAQSQAVKFRREMEQLFAPQQIAAQ